MILVIQPKLNFVVRTQQTKLSKLPQPSKPTLMSNALRTLRSMMLLLVMTLLTQVGWGQSTIFSENMGTPGGTTSIASNTFQNNGTLTYSNGAQTNSADVRTSSASSGYTGSSGNGNVFFTSTSGAYGFSIESINASSYTTLQLSFGYRKESATLHATFSVDYWNGSAWSTIANTSSSLFNEAANAGAGWYLSKTLSLPAAAQISGLKIRFVKTGTASIRIDDVKLTGYSPEINIKQGSTTYLTGETYGFGNQVSGTSSSVTTFTIENTGTATLNLTGTPLVSISGTNSSEFSLSTVSTSSTVAASGTTTFTVTFSPTSQGSKSAKISIANDDATGSENPYEINLTGTGTVSSASDVVVQSGYSYTSNVAYASYQTSSALTTSNSVGAMGLTIRDGGATTDADNLGTTLTALTLSTGASTAIRTAALFDGSTNVAEVAVNGATSIAFTSLTLSASDGSTKNLELRVTYQSTVTDNQQITYTVSSVTAQSSGSGFSAANGGAAASSSTGDINRIEVTVSQLVFGQQPSNVDINAGMSPDVTVVAKDANSNTDLDFIDNVRLTSTGTLTGSPVSIAAVSGTATFSSLTHTAIGTGLTLTAERYNSGAWDLDVASSSFNVNFASSVSDYFRSATANGNFGNASSWESSSDNTNWNAATLSPTSSSTSILIRNGHVITIASAVTLDQLTVQSGGRLVVNASLTVANGTDDDIVIQNGGQIDYKSAPTYNASATIRINGGGVLSIQVAGVTGNGSGVNATTHVYDDASILEWNLNTATPSSGGVTFFPNVTTSTVPKFRFSLAPQNAWGAATNTVVNGVLEIASGVTLSLQNSGTKTFRNGILINGNLSQGNSGSIIISGSTSQLGGSGTLTLGTGNMSISSTDCSLSSNLLINTNTVLISGTLDLAGYVLSGSTGISLTGGTGTLKTSHADGLGGSLNNSGTKSLSSGTVDFSSASSQTISAANYGSITNTGNGPRTLASSGNIDIASAFTPGDGTYTVTGSTVKFSASSGTTTITPPTVASGNSFNALQITGAGTFAIVSTASSPLSLASSLSVSAGTFNLNTTASAKTFNIGALTVSGGTFNGSTSTGKPTINVSGNMTLSSGTVNLNAAAANSPSVDLNITGTYTQTGGTINLQRNISTSADVVELSLMTVGGAFTMTGGTFEFATYTVSANSGNSAYVNLSGDFIRNGSANTINCTGSRYYGAFNFKSTGIINISTTTPTTSFIALYFESGSSVTLNSSVATKLNELEIVTVESGGYLNCGSYTVTGTGSFTNDGTLGIGSAAGITSIGATGNIQTSNRTFNTTANYVYSGSSGQVTGSGLPATVNNLTVDNTAGLTASSGITVNGELKLTNGKFAIGANTLTIAGTVASMSATNCLTGSSTSNLTLSGTGSLGTLYFDQTTPGTTDNIATFTLNRTSTGTAILGSNATVGTSLVLTNGLLQLGSNNLTVGASATIPSGSTSSYVQTNGSGTLTVNSISTTGKLLAIGNSTYNPITIALGNGYNWSARVEDAVNNVVSPFNTNKAVIRTWHISPSTNPPASGATITFQYNDGDVTQLGSSFVTSENVQLWHWGAYGGIWTAASGSLSPSGTAGGTRTISVSGLRNFSPFAIANISGPLPVSLLSFSGYKDGTRNQLRWVTASESNNRGFEVERSADGRTYQSIGFVNSHAPGGNSQSQLRYSFTDLTPGGNKQYYRLKQSDIDGRSTLSNILVIQGEKPTALELASVFPNPSSGLVTVLLNAPANDNVNIRLLDMTGRILETRFVSLLTGSNSIPFDLSKRAKGQYFIAVGEKVVRVVRE